MRVVYGAGAVAAMSVMSIGLVQPDWSSTDAGPTDDSFYPTDSPWLIAVLPDGTSSGLPDPTGTSDARRHGKVRHIIRYVYLKPGQTAPPGATVISASAPPRTGRNHPSNPDPTATPRGRDGGGNNGGGNNGGGNNGGGNNGGGVSTTPKPTQGPAATPRPNPQPTPKPTTRQSGHP